MQLEAQKVSLPVLLLVAALTAATVWAIPPEWLLPWLVGIGIVVGLAAYTFLGSPLYPVLLWFVAVACLHEQFARLVVPYFFNLTIPRVFLAVIVLLALAMLAANRVRIRWMWPAAALMVVILVYFTISAAVSGFQTIAVASVHYRLIGGYWFPVVVFALLVMAIRRDADVRRLLQFFFLFGLYLIATGWGEQFQAWSLVWPKFIADPNTGIHWGRVRGPFVASPIMGMALVYVVFNNLVLARMSGPLMAVICRLASLLALPVIFWTETRSVWLATLLGSLIWVGASRRGPSRIVVLSLLLAILIGGAAYNWQNITSAQREVGGVTSMEPIYVRLGLVLITWDIFLDHPFVGVGFGHFRDAAVRYAQNPSSPYYAFASSATEHNNFLSVLAECGAIGLILYLALLVAMFHMSIRLWRRLPPMGTQIVSRDLVVLYWIMYANFITDAMFRETSMSPFANSLFFGITAMVFSLNYLLGPEPLSEPYTDRAPASPGQAAFPAGAGT